MFEPSEKGKIILLIINIFKYLIYLNCKNFVTGNAIIFNNK